MHLNSFLAFTLAWSKYATLYHKTRIFFNDISVFLKLYMVFSFLAEYLCHVYVRNDNLGAVVIADTEYPQRVCFTLLDKVCLFRIKELCFHQHE